MLNFCANYKLEQKPLTSYTFPKGKIHPLPCACVNAAADAALLLFVSTLGRIFIHAAPGVLSMCVLSFHNVIQFTSCCAQYSVRHTHILFVPRTGLYVCGTTRHAGHALSWAQHLSPAHPPPVWQVMSMSTEQWVATCWAACQSQFALLVSPSWLTN